MRINTNRLTLIAGLSLLIPPVVGFLYCFLYAKDQTTTIFYPVPTLVLLPGLFIGPLAAAVPMIAFWVWNAGLFDGGSVVPKRSHVLLVAATVLSVLWFIVGWRDGIVAQGPRYNYSVCAINVAWILFLWLMFVRNRKAEPSFKMNLLLHWLLFVWLAWHAFPFFGEIT